MISLDICESLQWVRHAEQLLETRRLDEARIAFHRAEAMGADADRCASGRWFCAMLGGDFSAAWRESDSIRARDTFDPHRFWSGEPLSGKRVIVRCLHGFGDAVQMLRYAPWLSELAAEVTFEVPPRLVLLASHFPGVRQVIDWEQPAPTWDVQVEVMELPYIFRTDIADLPVAETYLRLPDPLIKQTGRRMGDSSVPRIGVVWAAGEWSPERSIPLRLLEPLFHRTEAEFWSLQGGPAAREAGALIESGIMRDATEVCGDGLLALAATVADLDLVITVDTLAAHLAGALGRPVWLLLRYSADWRWMTARNDTPWYPNMRLFRQPAPGDWDGAVTGVGDALRAWLTATKLAREGLLR